MAESSRSFSSFLSRWCDYLTISGVCALLVLTPLAFGTVRLWAFSLMEGGIFFLIAVWMGKLIVTQMNVGANGSDGTGQRSSFPLALFVPALLLVGVIGFQLLPLPPAVLSQVSPATHTLYRQSLPGWPEHSPYLEWLREEEKEETTSATQGELVSSADGAGAQEPGEWMPLSIAPALTKIALLKVIAYVGFFSLVLLYPFGTCDTHDAEDRFVRTIVVTVLASGVFIAIIALAQRFFWNGEILWFYVPNQWDGPRPDIIPRASGPFVNSDHFASYLVLSMPLLLGALLARKFFVTGHKEYLFSLFCIGGLLISFAGILLSLSRGGWISTAVAIGLLVCSFGMLPAERWAALVPRVRGLYLYGWILGIALCVFTLTLVGPSGREQIDQRIEETVTVDAGVDARMGVWKDSFGMIHDFPLFGVGLGAWQDLYPRYQSPPWSTLQWRETHNDYLQCLAETGVVGGILAAWFFAGIVLRLWRGLSVVPEKHFPLLAGIGAACGGVALHEAGDFSLQIPANTLLFTTLLALGLRIVGGSARIHNVTKSSYPHSVVAVGVGVLALVLCGVALTQRYVPYRLNPERFASVAEARANILAFPARRDGHLALLDLKEGIISNTELKKELEATLWLAPLNPEIRDQYVVALLEEGQQEAALREVQQSMFNSPLLNTHFYLTPEAMPQLDPPELRAIEGGLLQAVAADVYWAADGLGAFYRAMQRFAEAGKVYETAGVKESRPALKSHYMLWSARSYARSGEYAQAESVLRAAIQQTPRNPTLYSDLVLNVLAERRDVAAARAAIAAGARQGIPVLPLRLSLSDKMKNAGLREEALAVLEEALTFAPRSFDAHLRVGRLHLEDRHFDRALRSIKQALAIQPKDAIALYFLGWAEEGRYQYQAAQEAYAQALQLAPDNRDIQRARDNLKRKVTVMQEREGPRPASIATVTLPKGERK